MINLRSNRAKRQVLIYMDRQMAAIERTFVKRLSTAIYKQFKAVANMIEAGSKDYEHILHQTVPMFMEIFRNYYKRIYLLFGGIIFKQLEEQQKSFITYEKKGFLKDQYLQEMAVWSKFHMGEQIVTLHKSAKKIIGSLIEEMMLNGRSNREIAKEIISKGNDIKFWKATRIARTETHTVAMKSTNSAMATTRLKYTKEWLAAMDERTRPAHAEADGQEVDQDDYYNVGGEDLFFPGDPNGSPENIINCRCVEIYNTIQE